MSSLQGASTPPRRSKRKTIQESVFDWPRFGLLVPLVGLSWWSTTNGILGIVEMGSGPPTGLVIASIAAVVLVLTCLMSWTVGIINQNERREHRPLYIGGYILLATISIGFGFGFYWTMIEARASAQREAIAALEQTTENVSTAAIAVQESVRTIDQVALLSQARALEETEQGGTCPGALSKGPGPRYRLRQSDASQLQALSTKLNSSVYGASTGTEVQTWYQRLTAAETRIEALRGGALKTASPEEAGRMIAELRRELSVIGASYEGFRTGSTVSNAIATLNNRAAQGEQGFVDGAYAFTCSDPELETLLRLSAQDLSSLPPLAPVAFEAPLGAEATVQAFRRLTNTVFNVGSWFDSRGAAEADYALCLDNGTSRSQCASTYEKRVAGLTRLGPTDIVPLMIAVSVDLFIFLLSATPLRRPTGMRQDRAHPRMAVAYHLLARHQRQHPRSAVVLFMEQLYWHKGAYYVAVPVGSEGESPLSDEEYRLALSISILADSGFLHPVDMRQPTQVAGLSVARRYGRVRSRPIRRRHDIYRVEAGTLSNIVAELGRCHDEEESAAKVDEPSVIAHHRDWRFGFDRGARTSDLPSGGETLEAVEEAAMVSATTDKAAETEQKSPASDLNSALASAPPNAMLRWMRATVRK